MQPQELPCDQVPRDERQIVAVGRKREPGRGERVSLRRRQVEADWSRGSGTRTAQRPCRPRCRRRGEDDCGGQDDSMARTNGRRRCRSDVARFECAVERQADVADVVEPVCSILLETASEGLANGR